MNPKWLNFRNVNGIPYHMNEQGMWVSQFDGRVLTEAELNNFQSQGMMYMDDGWDTPPDIEVLYTGNNQPVVNGTKGVGLTAAPPRPRNHYKDYNRVEIEVWGKGGTGEDGNGPTNNGAGGGAGGYARHTFEFDRKTRKGVTIDFDLSAADGIFAEIYNTNGTTRLGGLTAYHGAIGGGAGAGVGGTGGTAASLSNLGLTAVGMYGYAAGSGTSPAGAGGNGERAGTNFARGGAGGNEGSTNGTIGTNPGAGGGGGWSAGLGAAGASGGVRLTYKFVGRS